MAKQKLDRKYGWMKAILLSNLDGKIHKLEDGDYEAFEKIGDVSLKLGMPEVANQAYEGAIKGINSKLRVSGPALVISGGYTTGLGGNSFGSLYRKCREKELRERRNELRTKLGSLVHT